MASPGEIVEGYEILRSIAQGGMGEVFLVRRKRVGGFEKRLAMKILHPHLADEPGLVSMFHDEARIASAIEHPNVVQVLDVGMHGRLPWLVMELLHGRALSAVLSTSKPQVGLRLAILAAAADGLHAAHEALGPDGARLGVVHRDVSPQNIHVGYDGQVKVVDFGIAAASGRITRTATGAVKGKYGYLAPEQIRGEPGDRRIDVWAFGVTAWEALAHRRLFNAPDAASKMHQILNQELPPLADIAPDAPKDIAARIDACLTRDRDLRPGELSSIARALHDAADALRVRAHVELVGFMTRTFAAERARAEKLVESAKSGPVPSVRQEASPVSARSASAAVRSSVGGTLLGRDPEVLRIETGLRSVLEARRPSSLLLVGSIGMGKTALRREAERVARALHGFGQALRARAWPSQSDALSLFRDLLLQRASQGAREEGWPSLSPEAPPDERREALVRLTSNAMPDRSRARECAEYLGPLLDVPSERDERVDPGIVSERIRAALVDYLSGLASSAPLALFLEDLQFADAASIDFLEELLGLLGGSPIFTFVSTRPELLDARPGLLTSCATVRVTLRGLSRDATAALADSVAGRTLASGIHDQLFERAGGNPLFVEQIVRALVDAGGLEGTRIVLPIPKTVEAAVRSRVTSLPPPMREIVLALAVLGVGAPESAIAALGVEPERTSLDALSRLDIVTQRPWAKDERAIAFRSAMFAEIAYASLDAAQRSPLHERAGRFFSSGPHADAARAAWHFERGGRSDLAAGQYVETAMAAYDRGDAALVLEASDRALSLGVPEEKLFQLRMKRAGAQRQRSKLSEQGLELAFADEHAATDVERAVLRVEQASWLFHTGRFADSIERAEESLALARPLGERWLIPRGCVMVAQAAIALGRIDDARKALAESAAAADREDDAQRADVAFTRAWLASAESDSSAATEGFEEAAILYAKAGRWRRALAAESNAADGYNRLAQYERAEEALAAGLAKCAMYGHGTHEAIMWCNIAYARIETGRFDGAREALEKAEALMAAHPQNWGAVMLGLYRARLALRGGAPEEAAALGDVAAREAQNEKLPDAEAQALTIAASALLLTGDHEGALSRATTAIAILDRLGGLSESESELHLAYALCLEANGRTPEGAAARRRGRDRVLALAAHIGHPAARKTFLERSWSNALLVGTP